MPNIQSDRNQFGFVIVNGFSFGSEGQSAGRHLVAFLSRLEAARDSTERQFEVAAELAARRMRELLAAGVPVIHFYALNRSKATAAAALGQVDLQG